MQIPADLRYSNDHEWVRVTGTTARVGITDYAQDALGDVVYVDPPAAGSTVTAGQRFGEVESTKSVSDLFAPVSGTVLRVNDAVAGGPDVLNRDPYGDGWLCEIEMSSPGEVDHLLDADAYRRLIEG